MKRSPRGAVLVESALVVGVIFVIIFGTLDIAIVGYDQMTVDAAAFTSAHYNTIGVTSTAAPAADNATVHIFPQIKVGDITHSTVPAPAPSTLMPVDYGYNGTIAQKAASGTNRTGGVSMMQPLLYSSTVRKQSVNVLGTSISVVGNMIEPMWKENGLHFNLDNQDVNGATPNTTYQGDAFANGENTPPYFVGYNIIRHCPDAQPWPTGGNTDCTSKSDVINFGVAEHLDWSNWGAQKAGADGSPASSTSTSNSDNAGLVNGTTFAEMSCHQKYFTTVATYLQSLLPYLVFLPSTAPLQAGINNFDVWQGFPPSAKIPWIWPGLPDGTAANAAVQTIYKWDAIAQIKVPPDYLGISANPLSPGAGC